MSGDTYDEGIEYLDDDAGDEEDEFERAMQECSSMRRGQCSLAGTEHCDFECPFHNSVFRRQIQASIRRSRK